MIVIHAFNQTKYDHYSTAKDANDTLKLVLDESRDPTNLYQYFIEKLGEGTINMVAIDSEGNLLDFATY